MPTDAPWTCILAIHSLVQAKIEQLVHLAKEVKIDNLQLQRQMTDLAGIVAQTRGRVPASWEAFGLSEREPVPF